MNSLLASSLSALTHTCTTSKYFNLVLTSRQQRHFLFISSKFKIPTLIPRCSTSSNGSNNSPSDESFLQNSNFHTEVTNPQASNFNSLVPKFNFSDQAFFLLAFIACSTSVAFTGLVCAAVPTLLAMRKAAISLSKLADTAREELPSTMTSIRLSVMEMNDLTLELSELSQEITEGVNKSAQALQAAKTGIQHIGSVAQQQTMSMIEERANLPEISLGPAVAGAARKTTRAVGRATKSLLNMISRRENTSEYDDDLTYMYPHLTFNCCSTRSLWVLTIPSGQRLKKLVDKLEREFKRCGHFHREGESWEREMEKKREELSNCSKICKRCKQTYSPAFNSSTSCRFHPSFFVCRRHDDQKRYYELGPNDPPYAAKFYDCCGAEDPDASGCTTNFHVSYDEE